jgi:PAX-interacting protein 1
VCVFVYLLNCFLCSNRQLGGSVAKNHQDCTHLVMPSLARTNKLLFCICREVHVVPEQWLRDSHTAQKFLDEASYSLDTKDFNSEYKCDFTQTLGTKNRNKLFEGKFFWITPSVFPSKSVLVELVQSCGGVVERIRRTSAQIEATNMNSPYSYIIITHENDIHLVADLLKNKKDKIRIVCSAELIFSAILKQTFEVEPFAVKVL